MNPLTHPRWLLHAEGAGVLAVSLIAYHQLGGNWGVFALLLLVPDLSALGYLVNVRVGATCYNIVHMEILPLALLLTGYFLPNQLLESSAFIWLAHIGIDRLAGFGLKYPTRFSDTHLQHV